MTEVEFKRLAAQGFNRIPLVLETFADLDTPLSIYLKLANKPYSYLLESVQGGERFGRYSFIGLASSTRINVQGETVLVLSGNRIAERSDSRKDDLRAPGDVSRTRRDKCLRTDNLERFLDASQVPHSVIYNRYHLINCPLSRRHTFSSRV